MLSFNFILNSKYNCVFNDKKINIIKSYICEKESSRNWKVGKARTRDVYLFFNK